jgi:hypothetical protein
VRTSRAHSEVARCGRQWIIEETPVQLKRRLVMRR